MIEDVPRHSHIQFEVLASYSTLPILEAQSLITPTLDNWSEMYRTYVYGLGKSQVPTHLVTQVNELASEHYDESDQVRVAFYFQSLNDIVPGADVSNNIGPKMMYLPLIILSMIALAI